MSSYPDPAELLAHRSPFLFCDEIVELEPGVSCTALWHLSGDESFFAGHFPGPVSYTHLTLPTIYSV